MQFVQNRSQKPQKEGYFPSEFHDFPHFGHRYPTIKFDEFLNASAKVDRPSEIVGQGGQGELGGDFLLPSTEEISRVVGVLDGAEGVFAGALAKFLFGNVALDKDHDALFRAFEFAEVTNHRLSRWFGFCPSGAILWFRLKAGSNKPHGTCQPLKRGILPYPSILSLSSCSAMYLFIASSFTLPTVST